MIGAHDTVLDNADLFSVSIRAQTNSNDFGGFWNKSADSNSNFVVAEFFFERFEFLVCSKFNHTHHVAVHVLVF